MDNYQQIKHVAGQQGGGKRFSPDDLFAYYQQRTGTSDFPTMLIALSATIMKADGKVLRAELDYVKTFFAHQFGQQFMVANMQTLKRFLESENIPLEQICNDIRMRTQEEARVQLLYYLFGIAKSDGNVLMRSFRPSSALQTCCGCHRPTSKV